MVGCVSEETVSDQELDQQVRTQLAEWWGTQVNDWKLLKIFRIPYAQPAQSPLPYDGITGQSVKLRQGLFIAGDHRNTATVNGALQSGQQAAKEIISALDDKLNKPKRIE